MKIWQLFKEYLLTKAVNGNLFYTRYTLPQTDKEKHWYNRGLQDSLMDVKRYEAQCESVYSKKYKSLLKCLSEHGIHVYYDEVTNSSHIEIVNDIKNLLNEQNK